MFFEVINITSILAVLNFVPFSANMLAFVLLYAYSCSYEVETFGNRESENRGYTPYTARSAWTQR